MRLFKRYGEVFFKIYMIMIFLMLMVFPSIIYAARPFVTDDTGTVGKNSIQIETGLESSSKKSNVDGAWVKEEDIEVSTVITHGIKDNLDLVLGVPYVRKKTKENGVTIFSKEKLSDITIEAKWRFFEKDGLGIAIKPGISVPSGDYKQGFGTGRTTYKAQFIASKEIAPFTLNFNGGYQRNENKTDERRNLFSSSFNLNVEVLKELIIGGEIGIASSCDPETKTGPAFFALGANYNMGRYLTIDGGLKLGLNKYEIDHSFILGFTIKF